LEEGKPRIDAAFLLHIKKSRMMQKLKPKDRRIFERFPLKCSLSYLDPDSNRHGLAEVCDFSAAGVGLLANEALPHHISLELWLHIPDNSEPLYTKGKVIWTKKVDSNKPQSQPKFHSKGPTFFHSSYPLPPPSFLRFLAL
jgi:hypothetical protein